jgi:hypothetical protein
MNPHIENEDFNWHSVGILAGVGLKGHVPFAGGRARRCRQVRVPADFAHSKKLKQR